MRFKLCALEITRKEFANGGVRGAGYYRPGSKDYHSLATKTSPKVRAICREGIRRGSRFGTVFSAGERDLRL